MLRTITVGTCVSVQGTFVRALPDGRIAVRVGSTIYKGQPVLAAA
jgi:biotin carboxyl carrier protein